MNNQRLSREARKAELKKKNGIELARIYANLPQGAGFANLNVGLTNGYMIERILAAEYPDENTDAPTTAGA
jgi:hypothetical protein